MNKSAAASPLNKRVNRKEVGTAKGGSRMKISQTRLMRVSLFMGAVLLAGCGGGGPSDTSAPTIVAITPGDGTKAVSRIADIRIQGCQYLHGARLCGRPGDAVIPRTRSRGLVNAVCARR